MNSNNQDASSDQGDKILDKRNLSDPEIVRYVRYLQGSLASEIFTEAYDQAVLATWTKNNIHRLLEISSHYPVNLRSDDLSKYVRSVVEYRPETEFQTSVSSRIYEPLINEIAELANTLGLGIAGPVTVANFPDIDIGPLSRSSVLTPMIFAGPGTSSFCNYWAKFYSEFFAGLTKIDNGSTTQLSPEDALRNMPKLLENATMLSIYYAFTGTVMGFGLIQEPRVAFGLRMELLKAMEIFILSHEYAHLYLEEKKPELQGNSDHEVIRKLEFECDMIGFALTRNYGGRENNWFAFSGAAAYLFFEAVKTCYFAKRIHSSIEGESDGHPSPTERQQTLFEFAIESANEDQKGMVEHYMNDLRRTVSSFSSIVMATIEANLERSPG